MVKEEIVGDFALLHIFFLTHMRSVCNEPYVMKHNMAAITKTYLFNFDLLKPLFYVVKLGFTGLYVIFVISA